MLQFIVDVHSDAPEDTDEDFTVRFADQPKRVCAGLGSCGAAAINSCPNGQVWAAYQTDV